MQTRRRWLLAWLFVLVSSVAFAGGRDAVRKQIEASMMVSGTIRVAEDGSVRGYTIDQGEALPKGVLAFVQRQVDGWHFDPAIVSGKAVAVRNKMSLLVVGKRLQDDQYGIRLQAVSFEPYEIEEGTRIVRKVMVAPRYPETAARLGVAGTVYLVLKIGADGKVQDAMAEQVNLDVVGTEAEMERFRGLFSRAALDATKKWEFSPPTTGEAVRDPYWSVRVPVDFLMIGTSQPRYGEWRSYVPGPHQRIPWAEDDEADTSPEALAAGGLHMVGKGGLRLLTPLGG